MPKEGKLICIKQCCNCGVDVEIHHKKRLLNKHIFCSRKCEAEFRRRETEEKHKELFVQCFYCGKMFYMKSHSKRGTSIIFALQRVHQNGKRLHIAELEIINMDFLVIKIRHGNLMKR